jgi:heme/copper-type cytochrome/quinol oxidase subunit 2
MTGLLIFLIIALILVVMFQVTKTLDMVSELRSDEREEERHASTQSRLLMAFLVLGLVGFFWTFRAYRYKLFPESASEHGLLLSNLFFWTLLITGIVFVITNVLLFVFAYQYRWKNNRRAAHIAHNNTLEFIWTAIPAVVLTFLVVLGLRAWNEITGEEPEDAMVFEMTGQQFFWLSRYPGPDGVLGLRDYNLISAENPLGLVTPEFIDHKRVDLLEKLEKLESRKAALPGLIASTEEFIRRNPNPIPVDSARQTLKSLVEEQDELPGLQDRTRAHYRRIADKFTPEYLASPEVAPLVMASYDDFQPSELHLPVNRNVLARITAIDVLHNFYIPYMSVKMDAVPGIPTRFQFKPTKTTEDMKAILAQNPEWQVIPEGGTEPKWKNFVYEVACAELCGKGHNSMRYVLNVGTEEEHNAWLNQQTAFFDLQKENLIRWSEEQYAQYEQQFVFVKDDSHHGGDHHDEDHHEEENHELHAGLKPTQAASTAR